LSSGQGKALFRCKDGTRESIDFENDVPEISAISNLMPHASLSNVEHVMHERILLEWNQLVQRESQSKRESVPFTERRLFTEMFKMQRQVQIPELLKTLQRKLGIDSISADFRAQFEKRLNFCHLRMFMFYAQLKMMAKPTLGKCASDVKECKIVLSELQNYEIVHTFFVALVLKKIRDKAQAIKYVHSVFVAKFGQDLFQHVLAAEFDTAWVAFGFHAEQHGYSSESLQKLCSIPAVWNMQVSTEEFLGHVLRGKIPLEFLKEFMLETGLFGRSQGDASPIDFFLDDFKCGNPIEMTSQIDLMALLLFKKQQQSTAEVQNYMERQMQSRPFVVHMVFADPETKIVLQDMETRQRIITQKSQFLFCPAQKSQSPAMKTSLFAGSSPKKITQSKVVTTKITPQKITKKQVTKTKITPKKCKDMTVVELKDFLKSAGKKIDGQARKPELFKQCSKLEK
jgi:hypothetical protein